MVGNKYAILKCFLWSILLVFALFPSVSSAMQQSDELRITQFAASKEHVLVVTSNGSVYAWGQNLNGQLGRTGEDQIPYPVHVSNLSRIVKVATGSNGSSAAVDEDGYVWTWGDNGYAQLGRTVRQGENHKPGIVLKGDNTPLTGIVDISVGDEHMIALDSQGKVWGWGNNYNGQVGHGGETRNTSKSKVGRAQEVIRHGDDSPLHNIIKITTGDHHSFAMDDSGNIWVWGSNQSNILGIGDDSVSHIDKASMLSTQAFDGKQILDISAGSYHTLALVEDMNGQKGVYGWGQNNVRQLGIQSFREPVPTEIRQPDNAYFPNNIIGIGAGGDISAIFAEVDGDIKVYTAGHSQYRHLGHSENEPGLGQINFFEIQSISNPDDIQFTYYNGYILQDGVLSIWGHNHVGQLGQGVIEAQSIGIDEAVNLANNFDTELSDLTVTQGRLYPSFHPDVQEYILHLGGEVGDHETLEITVAFPTSTKVTALYGGEQTHVLNLSKISMPIASIVEEITFVTTADNKVSTRTYHFHVVRSQEADFLLNSEEDMLVTYFQSNDHTRHAATATHTSDGGYLLGHTIMHEEYIEVVKLSSSGTIEWSRLVGEQSKLHHIETIYPALDGGYLLAGNVTQDGELEYFVYKISEIGDLDWKKYYNPFQMYSFGAQFGGIVELSQNDYIMIGYVDDYDMRFVLIHIDLNGVEQERHYYAVNDFYMYDINFRDIIKLPNGDIDMLVTFTDWDDHLLYVRIDADGDVEWMHNHMFEDVSDLVVAGIVYDDANADEGVIVGHTDENSFVLPFSESGFLVSEMSYYPNFFVHRSLALLNGDALLVGAMGNKYESEGLAITTLHADDWTISDDWLVYDTFAGEYVGDIVFHQHEDGTSYVIGWMTDEMESIRAFLFVPNIELSEDDDTTNPPNLEQMNMTAVVSSMYGDRLQVIFDHSIHEESELDPTQFKLIDLDISVTEVRLDRADVDSRSLWLKLSEPIPPHLETVILQIDAGAVRGIDELSNGLQIIDVLTPHDRKVMKQDLVGNGTDAFTIKHVVQAIKQAYDMNRDGIFDLYDIKMLLDSIDSFIRL